MGERVVISTGIPSLDRHIHLGGFKTGTLVLFVGQASSRKDLFGYHFLMEGLKNKEKVVFFDVEASSDEIMELIRSSGEKIDPKDLLFVDACPEFSKFYIKAAPAKIIDSLKMVPDVNRVLINPLTFFVEKFGAEDTGDFLIQIRNLAMKRNFTIVLLLANVLTPIELQSIIDKCDGVIELSSVSRASKEYHTIKIKKLGAKQKEIALSYEVLERNLAIQTTDRIA